MMKNKGENFNSDHILQFIEPNSVGAEVGVWKASSSIKFQKIGLKELHLIDPWSLSGFDLAKEAGQWDEKFFFRKYTKVVGGSTPEEFTLFYDKVYSDVCDKFAQNPEVAVFRGTFKEWSEKHKGKELDWVYVDGDHSEIGCKTDLELARTVVKPGGLIMGDDLQIKGVSIAVNDFCRRHKLKLENYLNQYRVVNTK